MEKVIVADKNYGNINGFFYKSASEISQYQILQILKNKEYYLNIWRTIILNDETKSQYMYYEKYTVKDNENWDTLSWKLYNTVDYWWILAFFNDIQNPFESLYNGQIISVLKLEFIPIFISMFNKQKDL